MIRSKSETIEEFLTRGGKINNIPPQKYEEPLAIIRSTQIMPQIMPLDQGELFFAEKQKRKKRSTDEKNQVALEKLTADMAKYLNNQG
jgi:hypothetical protein